MKADRAIFFALACALSFGAALPKDNYLLTDEAGIAAARKKAAAQPWAKAALETVLTRAARDVRKPVTLPDRGGQWPHWYSCKVDGVKLQTVSPTDHKCPKCGAVYHGEPFDSVPLYGAHASWSQTVRVLGLAYRFTGKTEYAAKVGEILSAYAGRYAKYPLHDVRGDAKVGGGHIMAQTLDESVWLIPVAFGYALSRDALTPAQREHIEKDLFLAAAETIRAHKMSIHNIQCWKNSAVGLAGYVAGNDALVKEAIDDPARGFRAQIEKGVTDDGLWYEGSLGYHAYTMDAVWPLAEAARLNGVDLYTDRFRRLFDAPLNLALPDGNAPGFNDNGGGNVARLGGLYELAYARWKRPEYGRVAARGDRGDLQALLYGAETLPAGPFIPTESVLMKDAGFAMLRAGGDAVAVRFGRHGGGHGHPDKLGIVTFAKGKLWGVDPGSINYGVPLHKEWYRATVAHNTVQVDGQNQAAVDGVLETFGGNGLTANAGAAYPGVTLRRILKLDAGALADRYECSAEAAHDYDYTFHAPGKFTSSLTFAAAAPLGNPHIQNVAAAKTDGDWWAEWEQNGTRYRISVKGAPGTVVYTGVAPGKNPADQVPLVVVRRHAAKTVYEVRHSW